MDLHPLAAVQIVHPRSVVTLSSVSGDTGRRSRVVDRHCHRDDTLTERVRDADSATPPPIRLDAFGDGDSRLWTRTTELVTGGKVETLGRVGRLLYVANEGAVGTYDPATGERR